MVLTRISIVKTHCIWSNLATTRLDTGIFEPTAKCRPFQWSFWQYVCKKLILTFAVHTELMWAPNSGPECFPCKPIVCPGGTRRLHLAIDEPQIIDPRQFVDDELVEAPLAQLGLGNFHMLKLDKNKNPHICRCKTSKN